MKKSIAGVLIFLLVLYGYQGKEYLSVSAGQGIQYEYDSLGRVVKTMYPDGTIITYKYDSNGNLLYNTVLESTENTESGSTEETERATTEENVKPSDTETEPGSTETEPGSTEEREQTTTEGNVKPSSTETEFEGEAQAGKQKVENHNQLAVNRPVIITIRNTATDIKIYSKFKKLKPVIKLLKAKKKNKKQYLKIQIRKTGKKQGQIENGYQIQYATNSKFKKAKYVTVAKKKKKSVTVKTWKVKKKKTYYVRVRAYMKTKTGKKIYTKYSKTKKIET